MADQIYLSYWLRGFTAQNMLRHFERMLRTFPFSRLATTGSSLRVFSGEYAEPAVLEQGFRENGDVDEALAAAKEILNEDCAFLFDTSWDLWQFHDTWKLTPSPVTLACFGPAFQDNIDGDHLRVEFGIDANFLPQEGLPNRLFMAQSNLKGLLHFVHELDDRLNAERRRLWSESGENFAERVQTTLRGEE